MTCSRESFAMNGPLVVATAAFLLLLPRFNMPTPLGGLNGCSDSPWVHGFYIHLK
jgi:hypothetical protein